MDIKQNLKKSLTRGIGLFFDLIDEKINPSSQFNNELILLQARHQRIMEESRLGIIDRIEMDKALNAIRFSALQIVDKLDNQDFYSLRDTSNKIKTDSIPSKFKDDKIGIIRFDNSYPHYKPRNIKLELNGGQLFFRCPESIKNEIEYLDKNVTFNEDINTIGKSLLNLKELIGENEFYSLLRKHKDIIANTFLEYIREGKIIFNGRLFGVNFARFNRIGEDEVSTAHLELYESDYYTYKVFRSLYHEIKSKHEEFKQLTPQSIKPFLVISNSIGLNLFITVKDNSGEERLIFTKRSKFVANEEFSSIWHVSVNETISQTDVEDSQVNLLRCVRRGIKEELGISENDYDLNKLKIYSFFLVKSVFEVGVSAFLKTNISYSDFIMSQENAKDAVLETEAVTGIVFNKKSIINFMKNHDLTPAAIHLLKIIIEREL